MSESLTPFLDNLPDPDEMYRLRRGKPLLKGSTRLDERKADDKADEKANRAFHAVIWRLDKSLCRHCLKNVIKSIERVPNRGEVHHVYGRRGRLRFEIRAALLLCLECHEQVTGTIGKVRLFIVGKTKFKLQLKDGWRTFTNVRKPVQFQKAKAA